MIVKIRFLMAIAIFGDDIMFILFDRQLIGRTALRRGDFEGIKTRREVEGDRFRLVATHPPAIEDAAGFVFQADFQPGAKPLQGTVQMSRRRVIEGVDVGGTRSRKSDINGAIAQISEFKSDGISHS